jgi:transposase
MQKPCSLELRERVVGAVESGASRREAADWFEVGKPQFGNQMDAASAGDGKLCSQAERGHHLPLEAHAAFLFALIARQPGLTLDEIVAGDAQAKDRWQSQRGVALLSAPQDQLQKKSAGSGARARERSARTAALDARARHV